MPEPSQRPISNFRKKTLFYSLSVGSGIVTSVWVILDTMGNYYIPDPYLFGVFEMVVGLLASIVLVSIFHIPLHIRKGESKLNIGYYFDPNFTHLIVPRGKVLLYTLLAGLTASAETIVYFILLQRFDASIIMPFSQFVLIYLLIMDSISDKEKPVLIEIVSLIMIAFGVIIATISGGEIDLVGLLLIFGPFSFFTALYIYFQKKALTTRNKNGKKMDTISLRMWTLILMTLGQVIAAIPAFSKGGMNEIISNWEPAFWPSLLSMLLVYVGVVMYTRALTMGKMSIVKALNSISVVATIPLVALASIWLPQIFSSEFASIQDVILKISGSVLILAGMIALALSEIKSMLLAKLKQGVAINIEELIMLKGVEKVAFITGTYDLLIRIRIRSMGRAYRLLEKNIAKIPWIDNVTTLLVMKEYE